MRVKVCGITRQQDAALAVELGAFAIGFIFVSQSPRRISVEAATEIARSLPAKIEKVGVFVDASLDFLFEIRAKVGLTMMQLHGSESSETARALGGRLIRAVRARRLVDIEALANFPAAAFLIDGPKSGVAANPVLACRAKQQGPVILAGGLRADNVARAIAIVRPMAVDVSSGIESEPGIKDPNKMRRFFAAVKGREFQ